MKEIKTYIANDGKVFEGKNARSNCMAYEKQKNANYIKETEKGFKKISVKLDSAIPAWWYGDDTNLWKVTLKSKKDYETLMDYFYAIYQVWEGYEEPVLYEPESYPYTTLIGAGTEWAYEYELGKMKKDLKNLLGQI